VPHQAELVICGQTIERTLAWLTRFRRPTVRYERRAVMRTALLTLGCGLICWATIGRLLG
jgi:transposase